MNTKFLVPVLVIGLAACSGNSGSSGSAGGNVKLFRGAVITSNMNGSMQLNGTTTLDTSGATVTMDDSNASGSDLQPGMVVDCKAHMDGDHSGSAMEVAFHDELQGTVDSIDGDTLVVMGQTVMLTADTVIKPSATDLVVGAVVEVSGARDANNTIVATRVEVKHASYHDGDDMEVKGVISMLGDTSFMLNDLTVNFDADTVIINGPLADGKFVEVHTKTAVDTSGATPIMTASKIEVKDPHGDMDEHDADSMEFRATIVSVTTDADMLTGMTVSMGGEEKTVIITADTSIKGDVTAFIADAMVEIEGAVNDDGSITASKIELEDSHSGMPHDSHTGTDMNMPATNMPATQGGDTTTVPPQTV